MSTDRGRPLAANLGGILFLICLTVLMAVFGGNAARAQESSDLSNIDRRLEQKELPKLPTTREPARLPKVPVPEPTARETAPFILSGVEFTGVTVFDPADLTTTYEDFLTRRVTTADIETILSRITMRYRDAGYFLSRAIAPEQSIQSGIVQVRVVEGFVDAIDVEGNYRGRAVIDRYGRAVLAERPLTLATFERALLLMNDLPGVTIDPSVRAVDEADGRYALVLGVTDKLIDASAQLDNRGTPEVGRLQGYLTAGLNSALGFGERLQANFVTVPNQPKELLYGALSATVPVADQGTSISVFSAYGAIDAGSSKDALDSDSRSKQVIGRIWHPLLRSRDQSLWITGTFDFRDFDETEFDQTVVDDRLRVLRAGATYSVRDPFKGENQISVEVSQGLDVLGASDSGDSTLSRADGDSEFTKLTGSIARLQSITDRIGLQLLVSGQWSADPLLSYEEFAVGGEVIGRAYDYSEISGEDGIGGMAELRYTAGTPWRWLKEYQVYGFYDFGAVWNEVSGGGETRDSLSSAGLGVRLELIETVRATVEAAKPLTRPVSTSDDDDWRFFFSVGLTY